MNNNDAKPKAHGDAARKRLRAPSPGIVSRSRYSMPGFAGISRKNFRLRQVERTRLATPPHGTLGDRIRQIFVAIPHALKNDVTAGMVLIVAAAIAIIWANSPAREIYQAISEFHFGPEALHLNMPLSHWAQDGLLTIFFFVVGLELKSEFVTGSLRDPREAALPMLAAVFGMIGPAIIFILTVTAEGHTEALHGWAIPAATDIAFAVAILQIFGRGMPPAARTFLLTLAVVDDLLGIIVIAIFYTNGLSFFYLAFAFMAIAAFGFLAQKRIIKWWLLLPLAIIAWYFMHACGVHATIAGVLLGFTVPDKRLRRQKQLTHYLADKLNVLSAGVAVPIFAFFAAGVNIIDTPGGPLHLISHPVAVAVALALPLGKMIGISGSVFLLTSATPLRLGHGVDMSDIIPISAIAGIGFTVALLISNLAFVGNAEYTHAGSLGVVMGTLLSVILGATMLSLRQAQPLRGHLFKTHAIATN